MQKYKNILYRKRYFKKKQKKFEYITYPENLTTSM